MSFQIKCSIAFLTTVTAGSFVTGHVYRILTVGTTDFTLIGASANTVGVIFTATGAGSGTGTATASGPFYPAPTFTDITTDSQGNPTVISFRTHRGRFDELDMMEPGTATIILNNASGNFWPGGLYSPNIKPLRRIKLTLVYNSVTYPLFEGLIDDWDFGWADEGGISPIVTLECTDVMGAFSRREASTAQSFVSQLTGARVGAILDLIPWGAAARSGTTPGSLDAGNVTLLAEAATSTAGAETHNLVILLDEANLAENGLLFIGADGKVYFYQRDALFDLTSQVTLSDNPTAGQLPYVLPSFTLSSRHIYNNIKVIRRGSSTIRQAIDTESQADYAAREYQQRGVIFANDGDASWLTIYKATRLGQPKMRIRSLKMRDNAFFATNSIMPKAVQYDIPTRVSVVCAQASINEDYYIQGIDLSYDIRGSQGGNLEVEWQLNRLERVRSVATSHTAHLLKTDINYLTAHNALNADAPAYNDDASHIVGQSLENVTDYKIRRAVSYFDLSVILNTETVVSAYLALYISAKGNTITTYALNLVDGALVSQPIVVGDYNDVYFSQPILGTLENAAMEVGFYNQITLNAAGIAWVQAYLGNSNARLGMLMDTDISATAPGTTQDEKISFGGQSGSNDPLLIIEVA